MASLDLSLFAGLHGPASRAELVRILLDHDDYGFIEWVDSVPDQSLVMVVHRRVGGDIFRLTYVHASHAAETWALVEAEQYNGPDYR